MSDEVNKVILKINGVATDAVYETVSDAVEAINADTTEKAKYVIELTGSFAENISKSWGSKNVTILCNGNVVYSGDLNVPYFYVGDYSGKAFDGSVDFGTASNVNVNGQMIIGRDTNVAEANKVTFGDVTGENTTSNTFLSDDVSVRRDGELTIANTTGENIIKTMNVMGTVNLNNAYLEGEVQIGGTTNGIMNVVKGSTAVLGGSSNSMLVIGKSTKGTLNINNSTVTINNCGPGSSYPDIPAGAIVIGYKGGEGVLNLSNNATFNAKNVLLNHGSSINAGSADSEVSNVNISELSSSGVVTVKNANFVVNGNVDNCAICQIGGLTDDQVDKKYDRNVTVVFTDTDGKETVIDAVINKGAKTLFVETALKDGEYSYNVILNETELVSGTTKLANGTIDIAGGDFTAETVNNNGTFKVTGADASTVNAKITGNALQLAGGVLEDSNIDGNIQVTGTSAMQGENTVANSVIKVSGGELTISGSLTGPAQLSSNGYPGAGENYEAAPEGGYPADNKVFIQAGDDDHWGSKPGLANNGAGTINIAGDVFVSQANANGNGIINVQSDASLNLNTLCVENGKIDDAKAGVLNIYGDTNAELIQVFNGGTINVYTGGELFTNTINKGRRQIIVGAESLLNVEGGSVKVETANETPGTETTKVGIDVTGTMQVSNNGSVEVGHFTDDEDWKFDAANTYINVVEGGLIDINTGSIKTTTLTNAGTVTMTNGTIDADTLTNNGTVKVAGASDIKAAVSGAGWMYMNGVTLDKDTQITGAKIRFASGNNVIDGATINTKDAAGMFEVGARTSSPDPNVDYKNPITVTVKNSTIASGHGGECAYVGANNTLAIENSLTYFKQINSYGNFSITGDYAGNKFTWGRDSEGLKSIEYSTYFGTLNISDGEAKFVNTSFHALNGSVYGTLTVDASEAYFTGQAAFNVGLYVKEGGVLSITNASTVYYNNFDNAGTISLNGEKTKMILTGVKKTDNVTTPGEHNNQKNIEILNNATLTDNGVDAILNNNGTITVNGGTLDVTNLNNSGKVVFENGGINVQKLDNKSSITVDAAACITVDTFTNSGVVNICVDGLNASTATVIDAKDGTADFGNVQFVDAKGKVVESGYGYHIDDVNGDLIVYKAAEETIYVNAEWTGKTFGEAITYGDKTLYYGIDACDNAADATANMTEKTTALVFTAGNVDDSYGAVRTTQSVVLSTVGDGYAYVDRICNGKGDVTIAAGSKFLVVENNGSMTGANNSGGQFIINGELKIEDSNGFYFWGKNSTPGQLIVNKGGLLTSTFSTFENHGSATVYGKVVLGTEDKKGFWPKLAGVGESNNTGWAGHLLIDGQYGEGEMTVYADGINFGGGNISGNVWVEPTGGGACSASIVNGGKLIAVNAYNFSNGSNCTLTISNKGLLDIQGERVADPVYFQNLGSIVVSDQAEFRAENHSLTNNGSLEVANATFTAGKITNNGTITISGTSTINATITGNVATVTKGAALTLVDSALVDGLDSYSMKLDVNKITDIKSINGIAIAGNATIGYFFTIKDTIYSVADKDSEGLTFTAYTSKELDENGNVAIDDYNGSIDNFSSSLAVEAKAGTATLKVSKGQSATVAEITKNENGGVTNLSLKGNLTVGTTDDHGSVSAVGKITTGTGVTVKLGDVSGTNLNTTISLGKNNKAVFDNIDMKGGKNTLSIGANSDVTVDDSDAGVAGSITNVKTIKLANGTAANAKKGIAEDKTTLTIKGDIIAPAMKNSITLGNYARLDVTGSLINSDVNVGTTIKAGKYSTVTFENINYAAGINMGANSFFVVGDVTGTAGKDKFAFGAGATATINRVDMMGGKNTFSVGANAEVVIAKDLSNVSTLKLAKGADLTAGNFAGVNASVSLAENAELTLTGYTTVDENGDPIEIAGAMTGIKKVDLGKNAAAAAAGISGDNVELKLATGSNLEIAGAVTGVNKVNVAKGAALNIDGILEGTAKNDTITFANDAAYSDIGSIDLDLGNDKLAIGNNAQIKIGDIDFGEGNNTMTIGKNANVNAGNIIFGEGTKDTLTLGADSKLFTSGIEGVETINADKSSVMIIKNGAADVNFDGVKGTWKNATIIDQQGNLADLDWASGDIFGSVYGNGREIDSLEFSVTDSNVNDIRVDDISEGVKIELWQKDAEGNWTFYADIPSNDFSGKKDLEIGDYAIAVKVDGNDTEKKDYSFKAYLA